MLFGITRLITNTSRIRVFSSCMCSWRDVCATWDMWGGWLEWRAGSSELPASQARFLTSLPRRLHPAGWCPSQEPDGLWGWKQGDQCFPGNLHTCSLSGADLELWVLQPLQLWWSLASATVKRHCYYRADCPLLSAAVRVPRECILLRDHKFINIAERRQCLFFFFLFFSVIFVFLVVFFWCRVSFLFRKNPSSPKTPALLFKEKINACEHCRFYQRLKAPSSGFRATLQATREILAHFQSINWVTDIRGIRSLL